VGRAHAEMSGYMAGDEVKIDTFEFLHEMNVKEVTATFVHEDGEHEIELTGFPSDDPWSQEVRTSSGPRLFKYGTVELQGFVGGEAPPGEYRCANLTVLSAGDNEIAFEETPPLRFVVVLEPARPPHIRGTISLGPQQVNYPVKVYDEEKDKFVRPG
jgi:hypothetical protein